MAATRSLGKATLLALCLFAILNLQGAEAQTANCTTTEVPGWGIAMLVLLSILLALALCTCCAAPLMCRGGGDSCQSGFSFGKSC